MIEHPNIIKNLKEVRDSQLETNKISPLIEFSFGFDDVFGRLKQGYPGGMDMYCEFNIGTKSITLY